MGAVRVVGHLGEIVWVGLYVGLGYTFADNITALSNMLGNASGFITALVAVIGLGWWLMHVAKKSRAAHLAQDTPAPHIYAMIKFVPILLAIGYAIVMFRLSSWRLSRELDDKSTELADPKLRALTAEMAKVVELPHIKVHIYEIEPVNGLAAPDGRIFITRGFFNKYKEGDVTAEEMASVIAHELGHVALGHSRRRMIDFSGQNALRTALAMVLSRFIPGLGPIIANAAMSMLMARLSRSDEYEADAYASALMIEAGIGTGPQKTLFTKLDKLTGARGAKQSAWLLSHPKTLERIAAIEANEIKWNG